MKKLFAILLFAGLFISQSTVFGQKAPLPVSVPALETAPEAALNTVENTAKDTLLVVWSSGDIEVAEKVCFMYTYNAKRAEWFKEVIFVVWGPSAKLLAEKLNLIFILQEWSRNGQML